MGSSMEICVQVIFVLTVVVIGNGMCVADSGDDRFMLRVQPDAEIESLIESGDFSGAEQLARDRNLNPRIIAVLCAKNGKKEEAFEIFADFIREAPEDRKKELAFQSVNFLTHNISRELGEELFRFLTNDNALSLSADQMSCAEVTFLIRAGKLEEAEHKVNLLLDSSYTGNDLVSVVILLVMRMNMDLRNLGKVRVLLEKLLQKFPSNLNVKLQWIDSLATVDSPKALIELDNLKRDSLDFYAARQPMIHLIRGKALEKIGEIDRAKTEYQALVGHSALDGLAGDKIREYESAGRLEQELQEKIVELDQPYELPEPAGRPWGLFLGFNAVLIAIIIYLLCRKKKV